MGFGRIGRDALRIWALREDCNFEVTHVAVRNLEKTLKERTHLFKFDSIYRRFPGEIEFTDDGMIINGKKVTFVESKTPDQMNWKELGVDIVIDSSGAFKDEDKARGHLSSGAKKVVLMLSYPSDEVGNELVSLDKLDEAGINPYSDVLTLEKYRELFGENKHEFTGVDYVDYYANIIKETGAEVEVIFANNPRTILNYTKNVLNCDIHTRVRTKRILRENGAERVCGLDDILNASVNGSGYNTKYGLLGSNKSTEDKIKLFPNECFDLVEDIQKQILDKTGKHVEVMVYGDGAFKDPQGKIWELADPVVSPAYTEGLIGTPNEVKLKYLADNDFKDLSGEALKEAISKRIREKSDNLVGDMASQGTTPRQLTDLIGSLCDLTSGSGDKGTPVVLVQGYFDNYTN